MSLGSLVARLARAAGRGVMHVVAAVGWLLARPFPRRRREHPNIYPLH